MLISNTKCIHIHDKLQLRCHDFTMYTINLKVNNDYTVTY